MTINRPFIIRSTEKAILNEARSALANSVEAIGEIYEEKSLGDLKFDPMATVNTIYAIMGVIATIGGTIQLVEWLLLKVKGFKNDAKKYRIIIVLDGETFEISTEVDVEQLRSQLENILNING